MSRWEDWTIQIAAHTFVRPVKVIRVDQFYVYPRTPGCVGVSFLLQVLPPVLFCVSRACLADQTGEGIRNPMDSPGQMVRFRSASDGPKSIDVMALMGSENWQSCDSF